MYVRFPRPLIFYVGTYIRTIQYTEHISIDKNIAIKFMLKNVYTLKLKLFLRTRTHIAEITSRIPNICNIKRIFRIFNTEKKSIHTPLISMFYININIGSYIKNEKRKKCHTHKIGSAVNRL